MNTDLHPYDRPLLSGVYQGHTTFPARVTGCGTSLPGMPRAWADKAAVAINACATKTEQLAEVARIRKSIAGSPCIETPESWPQFPAAYRATLVARLRAA